MFQATAYEYNAYLRMNGPVLHTEQHANKRMAQQRLANHYGLTTQLYSFFRRDDYLFYRTPNAPTSYFNVYMEVKEVTNNND